MHSSQERNIPNILGFIGCTSERNFMSYSKPQSYHRSPLNCKDCSLMWGLGAGVNFCIKPLLDRGVIKENPNHVDSDDRREEIDNELRIIYEVNPDLEVSFYDGTCHELKE